MSAKEETRQDAWSESMSKYMEAARHNMTAVNLAAAGSMALGAAAVAYMWDAQRRNALLDSARRWTDMNPLWQRNGPPEANP